MPIKHFDTKMMKKWLVIYLCAVGYFLNRVDAKICERIEAVTSMVEVTFSTAYIATYHGQCYYGCIKTHWTTSLGRRYVPKREWKTIKYCCSGYLRTDDSSNDSDIVCEPICMPACKNGHCRAPAECACDAGYVPDPKDSHNCLPSCEKGCDHGACVAPDTCRCDFGYILVNTTCHPVCTEPCHNGTCLAPETCECLTGFRKSEKNLCEPYCSNGCDNGFCIAPETCRCNSGWHFKEGQDVLNKHCEPVCSEPCDNGTCVAPETCVCNASYKKSKSGICEPECIPPCGNGTCIAPHKCSCFPGYHNKTNNITNLSPDPRAPVCIPTCAHCKDDHCVAPNKCLPIDILRTNLQLPDRGEHYDIDDELYYDDYYSDLSLNSYFENNRHVISKISHSDETKKETIKNPFHRSTRPDKTNTDIVGYSYETSTADDIDTKSIRNFSDLNTRSNATRTKSMNNPFDNKSTRSYDTTMITGSVKNPNNTSDEPIDSNSRKSNWSWLQQHGVAIFIPVLVIATAAVIMLLVWRWAPIIIFFKGRSYIVEGDPVDNNGSRPFEDIQISAINETEKTAQK